MARVISEIKHRTARGADTVIRFMATEYGREYFEAEIPALFTGARQVDRSKMRDKRVNGGKPQDCFAGTFERDGHEEPFGIALTPDLLEWHKRNLAGWKAEQEAARAAELKVWYPNRRTWEHQYRMVDGRLTDNEIIAGLSASVLDAATEEGFREGLAQARGEKAAKDAAKAGRATRFQDAQAEAKRTGRPVELRRYMANCDGSVTDCSTDLVIEMVHPDGTIREERTHTF